MPARWTRRSVIWAVLGAAVLTAAIGLRSPSTSRGRRSNWCMPCRHRYPVAISQFRREMGVMLGPGDRARQQRRRPAERRRDLPGDARRRSARRGRPINFETYIYWSGDIGQEFADALTERARAGRAGRTSSSTGPAASRWTPRCSTR